MHIQRCDNYVLDVIFILIFNNNKYSVSVKISEDLDYSYFMMVLVTIVAWKRTAATTLLLCFMEEVIQVGNVMTVDQL